MPVTAKDVALHAGVSTATVSRVINNDSRITEETRSRVIWSIAELGYQVNTIARSLKMNRTCTVGFLTPEFANDFFMTLAEGAEAVLRDAGYSMLICNSGEQTDLEKQQAELLLRKCVDGIILIPASSRGDHLRFLADLKVPLVLADRLMSGFSADAVLVDNVGGSRLAIEELIRRGRKNFGFIGGNPEITPARERYEGFISALKARNVAVNPGHIKTGDFHVESGYLLMKELMETKEPGLRPPETLFIANYYMHIGAVKYLVENHRTVGKNLFLASFDDMALSGVTGFPGLTVAQPIVEIGRTAAKLLLRRIGKDDFPFPEIVRLPARLVDRE